MMRSRTAWNHHGDGLGYDPEPTVTITLTGYHEIVRFALHMQTGQCEFADEGRRIRHRLKRKVGTKTYRRIEQATTGRSW